jgi:hypothetical protein
MKKKVCILLAVMMVLTALPAMAVAGATGVITPAKVVVDGKDFTFTGNKPVVKDGIVFFPLETQALSMFDLTVDGMLIRNIMGVTRPDINRGVRLIPVGVGGHLQIDKTSPGKFNGFLALHEAGGNLPAPAQEINGVWMAPLAPLAEALGGKVEWNAAASTITVTTTMSTVWTYRYRDGELSERTYSSNFSTVVRHEANNLNEDGTVRAFPWVAPLPSEDGVYAPIFVELFRDPDSVESVPERAEHMEHYWLRAQVPSPVWEITEWLTEEQVYERLMALQPRWKEIAAAYPGCNIFAGGLAKALFGRDLMTHWVEYGIWRGKDEEVVQTLTPARIHQDLTQIRVGDFVIHDREGGSGHTVVVMRVTEDGFYALDEGVVGGHERWGLDMIFYPFAWLRGEVPWWGYTSGARCPGFVILTYYTPLWEGHLEDQEYPVTQWIHARNDWPWP